MQGNVNAPRISGELLSENDTRELAKQFGQTVLSADKPVMLALEGNLGAGKSFFARSLLQQFGVTGAVRSPTYTLIEPYECELGTVLHLDLYRLADPEEVLYLGLEDQLVSAALVMVEWPEKASGYLDNYDVRLTLEVTAESRRWQLTAISDTGERLLRRLKTQ